MAPLPRMWVEYIILLLDPFFESLHSLVGLKDLSAFHGPLLDTRKTEMGNGLTVGGRS
jgi:hypothetical protein